MDRQQLKPIIKTLDNSPRILFWSVDEFLCLVGPLFLGMCIGGLAGLLLALSGVFARSVYKKAKKALPGGSLNHRIYWFLPDFYNKKQFKSLPPAHKRDYLL